MRCDFLVYSHPVWLFPLPANVFCNKGIVLLPHSGRSFGFVCHAIDGQ